MSLGKKIVIDENIPYIRGVLEPFFEVAYRKGQDIDRETVKEASALIVRTRTRCDSALLSGSNVEFVGTATIGYDHIDTAYCTNYAAAPGCNARAVMQYIASALVHLSRDEGWSPAQKTIGVVGMGNVGSLVADLGRMAGFGVLCCDPPKMLENPLSGCVSLDCVLEKSDIVTLHVPLNVSGRFKTLAMADEVFFGKMRRGATFMNTSRGAVVNEQALLCALNSGHVGSAVIDVWNNEPEIDRRLLEAAKFATPHIAGYSIQGKANATAAVVRALARHFGLPLTDWYPPGVPAQVVRKDLDWDFLCRTIDNYYDIRTDTAALKSSPSEFERLRNEYSYRVEYF